MSAAPAFAAAPIGHNSSREQIIRDEIAEHHGHLKPRTDQLLTNINEVPDPIPEDLAPKVADFIKSITAHVKALNGARTAVKEPYLEASRLVDGIFKTQIEPLEAGKKTIEARLGVVLRAKEERQRREAEEKARLEREAAEQRRREAEERARLEREAAETARREAEEAERRAQEAAEQRRREAEAAARAAEEAAAKRRAEIEAQERAAAERLAAIKREEEEAAARRKAAEEAAAEAGRKRDAEVRAAKAAEEKLKREAAEAERRAEEERKAAEKAARLAEAEEEARRIQADKEAKEAQRQAERDAEEAARAAKAAERDAGRAERDADRAASQEHAAQAKERRVETAKPAEFARTRGDYGGLATLRREWTYANIDRAKIDLETLRHHLPEEALGRAVRSFIDAGGRSLEGVDIFEDDSASVR